jgi:hypothetical protein
MTDFPLVPERIEDAAKAPAVLVAKIAVERI